LKAAPRRTCQTTADTIEAMFKVLREMAGDGVAEEELNEARMRVVGRMVMGMQTVESQASYRVEGILNDYPIDYYDRYPERISAVAPTQVAEVVGRYVRPDRMTVVVVAPAEAVKDQLARLGEVRVVPMPAQRPPRELAAENER
jgi:zinc protease